MNIRKAYTNTLALVVVILFVTSLVYSYPSKDSLRVQMNQKNLLKRIGATNSLIVVAEQDSIVMNNKEVIDRFDWDSQPVKTDNDTYNKFKEVFILVNLEGEVLAVLTEEEANPNSLSVGKYEDFYLQILNGEMHLFNIRHTIRQKDISQAPYAITAYEFKNKLTNYQIKMMKLTEDSLNPDIAKVSGTSSQIQTLFTSLIDLMPEENIFHIDEENFSAEFTLGRRAHNDDDPIQFICLKKTKIPGEYAIFYKDKEVTRFRAEEEISIGRDERCDAIIDKDATEVDQIHAKIKVSKDEKIVTVNDVSKYGMQGQRESVFLKSEFHIESQEHISAFHKVMSSVADENPIMETIYQKGYTANLTSASSRNFPKQGDTITLTIRIVGETDVNFGGLNRKELELLGEAVKQNGLLVERFTWRVQPILSAEDIRTVLRNRFPNDNEKQFDTMIKYCQGNHKHFWIPRSASGVYRRMFHKDGEGQIRMVIYTYDSNADERDIKRVLTERTNVAFPVNISNSTAKFTGQDKIEIDITQVNPEGIIKLYEKIKQTRTAKEEGNRLKLADRHRVNI